MKHVNNVSRILFVCLLIGALYISSLYSYLLFHTIVEALTVIVMISIFVLAWNTRHWMDHSYFVFIGIAFLFVGFVDLVHTLAYRGMNIFQGYDANLPTQLWILARYIQSISLLVAPIWLRKRLPVWIAVAGYFSLTIISLWLVFNGTFPDSYVEGAGLTQFKIISEYIIILILIFATVSLVVNKARFETNVLRDLLLFMVLSMGAEFAFTAYLGVYDAANLIGHIIRLISYFLLYRALITIGLQQPFGLIFRDLKLKEEALQRSESDLQRLFDINPYPVVITALSDSRILKANQTALDIFGLSLADLKKFKGLDFYANPDDRLKMLGLLKDKGRVENQQLELKTRTGKQIWCLINIVLIEMNGEPALLIGLVDITDQMRTQEELRYLSTHDALTGVYNRNYFEAEMERLQRGRRFPVSIIMLDVDGLKEINDTYGHPQGDKILRTVGRLVKDILRAEEVFARIGGDEFAILLPHAEHDTARQVVARIQAQLERHASENGGSPIKVSLGIGVANENEDLTEALKRADAHMYSVKSVRKGNTQPRI